MSSRSDFNNVGITALGPDRLNQTWIRSTLMPLTLFQIVSEPESKTKQAQSLVDSVHDNTPVDEAAQLLGSAVSSVQVGVRFFHKTSKTNLNFFTSLWRACAAVTRFALAFSEQRTPDSQPGCCEFEPGRILMERVVADVLALHIFSSFKILGSHDCGKHDF